MEEEIDCPECEGVGLITCDNCMGGGCSECEDEGEIVCPECDGSCYIWVTK
jgi:hypothetical protein